MDSIKNHIQRISACSFKIIGLAAAVVCISLPANLFGESLVRTISLDAADQGQDIQIPVGSAVTIHNNYTQDLYQTSIITDYSEKKLLSIDSFPAGQSFGLEFPKKGPYSICYRLDPDAASTRPICLQIHVVPLQTA